MPDKEFDNLMKGDTIYFSSDYERKKQQLADTAIQIRLMEKNIPGDIRFTHKHKIQQYTWTTVCKKHNGSYRMRKDYIWKDIGEWHIRRDGDLIIVHNKKMVVLNWRERYNEFIRFRIDDVRLAD
jgi:hypothetical protein